MGVVTVRVGVGVVTGALGVALGKMVGQAGVFMAAVAMQACLGIPAQMIAPVGMAHGVPRPVVGMNEREAGACSAAGSGGGCGKQGPGGLGGPGGPRRGVERAVLHVAHAATLMMGEGPEMVLEAYGLRRRLSETAEGHAG